MRKRFLMGRDSVSQVGCERVGRETGREHTRLGAKQVDPGADVGLGAGEGATIPKRRPSSLSLVGGEVGPGGCRVLGGVLSRPGSRSGGADPREERPGR